MNLFGKKSTTGEMAQQHRHKTAIEWMPIDDVYEGVICRKDGYYVAVVEVFPINLSLLSDPEQERRVSALHEAINGLRGGFQLVVLPHPVDVNSYIRILEHQMHDTIGVRRSLLSDQLIYVRSLVSGGQATEWRYYMAIASLDRGDAIEQAKELVSSLTRTGLQALLLDETGMIGMMHTWAHPTTAVFERPMMTAVTTLYEGVKT